MSFYQAKTDPGAMKNYNLSFLHSYFTCFHIMKESITCFVLKQLHWVVLIYEVFIPYYSVLVCGAFYYIQNIIFGKNLHYNSPVAESRRHCRRTAKSSWRKIFHLEIQKILKRKKK